MKEQPAISLREKYEQLEIFFESLQQPAVVKTADELAGSQGSADRRVGGVRITEEALTNYVEEIPQVDFIGQRIKSIEDLAIRAQALRNPGFETFYLIAIKGKKVMDAMAVTSRLPFAVSVFTSPSNFGDWSDFLTAAGADSYYMVHNHPSGDPTPSREDVSFTRFAGTKLEGFRSLGHVVVNHDKYHYIDGEGNAEYASRTLPSSGRPDPFARQTKGDVLGREVTNPATLAEIAKTLNASSTDATSTSVIFLTTKMKVASTGYITQEEMDNLDIGEIRDYARKHGVTYLAFGVPDQETGYKLARKGWGRFTLDIIMPDLSSMRESGSGGGKLFEDAKTLGERVQEDTTAPLASPTRSTVTPAQDAAYLAAVEAGDMETVQRMVDEAARAADVTYLRKVPIKDISHGELPGVDRELQDGDAEPIILERTGQNGEYLALVDGYHRLDGMIDYGETEVTAIILNSQDAEALADNSPREIERVQQEHEGDSADPVTRDESGNVIPLSERFNPESDSILRSPSRPPPPAGFDYTKARWASPSLDEQLYPIAANEDMRALARDWHMERSLRQAIEELEQETSGLEPAAREMARGFAIRRAAIMRDSTDELEQAIGSSLVHRASRLRNEQRRGAAQELQAGIVTNRELVPFAPVLAAENALIDRADAVMRTRFTGGATAAAAEVQAVATTAGTEASATVAAILDDATTPPPLPATAEEQARVTELERQLTEARQNLTSQRNANSTFQQILEVLKGAGAGKAKVLAGAKEAAIQAIRMAKAMVKARAAGQTPQQSPTGNTQTAANAAAPDLDPDVLLAVATGTLFDNTNNDTFRQVMVAEFGPSITPQLDSLYEKAMVKMRDLLITSAAKVKATKGKATQPKPAKSPNLTKLLNLLRRQTFPGMQWSDIFSELPNEQKTRQRELYQRVKDHPQLGNLTADQRLELTNQLDKVWQEERSKAAQKVIDRITSPKEPADRAKLKKAMPKMLRWINLGALDAETFRAAVAPEYGLRTMTAAEATRLKAMAEEAYNLPEGVLRDRKLNAMMTSMQKVTGLSRRALLNSYWTASVLSGLRTQFVIGMAALNGFADIGILSAGMALRGRPGVALQAIGAWTRALPGALADAWQIIAKGDYTITKRFNESLHAAMDGTNPHWRAVPLGEALWANGKAWSKAPAAVMIFTGRLMDALDHITTTATTEGAMVIARAMNPKLYANAAPTAAERTAARQQATNEVTGGAPPNAAEAATIRARTREILAGVMDPDTYQEASFIGSQAAMQNRPAGMMGYVYDKANQWIGDAERSLAAIDKNEKVWPSARALMALVGGVLRPLTGTQFLRAGFNVGNQFISYMPGTAVLSLARQAAFADPLSKSQNALLIGRNVVGLAVASAIVAAFVGKDDEEEGWHIEGLQENLTKEQKALRLSVGIKPGSFWKRENGQITSYLYRDNPLAGIFASVGAAQDIYRADPEQFKREGVLRHIVRGYALGMMQVKEANAMGALMEAIGASSYTADPEDSLMQSITKLPKSFVGGLIPTIIKDAEIWSDPRRFKPEGIFQELIAQVPVLRKTVNGGLPALDRLGNDIRQDRAPWSRALVTSPSTPAKAALAKLMAKGLDLPGVGTQKLIRMADGSRVPLETLGPKAVHDYTKAVGKRWQAYLTSEDGAELLTMPTERAAKVIRHKDEVFKIQATAEVER